MRLVATTMCGLFTGCMFAPDQVLLGRPGGDTGGGDGFIAQDPVMQSCKPMLTDYHAPIEPLRPPPALSGGNLGVMADGTVVVGDSDRDTIWVFPPTLDGHEEISLLPDDEPGRVIEGPPGHAFVVLRRAGQVAEVSVAPAQVVDRYDACAVPRGVAWDDASGVLFVACGEGVLVELTLGVGGVIRRTVVPVADDLRDVVRTNGGVWVSTFRRGELFEVTSSGEVYPLVKTAYASPLIQESPIQLGLSWRMIPDPSGVLVTRQIASKEITDDPCVVPEPLYGGGGGKPPPLRAVATVIRSLGGQTVDTGDFKQDLTDAVLPVDVARSGDEVAVVAAGVSAVFVLSQGNMTRIVLDGIPTAVGYSGSTLVAFVREPAQLIPIVNLMPGVPVKLSTSSVASTAFDLFHLANSAPVACASCHPEAGDDGNVWTLPEGRVRTPSLRGGISSTAPFHWLGEETTLDTLMLDIFSLRMGGLAQSPERTAALGRWLDAQPARQAPPLNTGAIARGAAIFQSPETGCMSCHSGSLGTNNTSVDVGTGERLQVPRLVELAYRAPFLHDGRAATLANRFGAMGGGDLHGHTSQLSPQEIDDLVTYLRSR